MKSNKYLMLCLLLLTSASFAEQSVLLSQTTKTAWFTQIKMTAPEAICSGFLEDKAILPLLQKANLNQSNCMVRIKPIIEQCEHEFTGQIPEQLSEQDMLKWGHVIGECIGQRFAANYLGNNQK